MIRQTHLDWWIWLNKGELLNRLIWRSFSQWNGKFCGVPEFSDRPSFGHWSSKPLVPWFHHHKIAASYGCSSNYNMVFHRYLIHHDPSPFQPLRTPYVPLPPGCRLGHDDSWAKEQRGMMGTIDRLKSPEFLDEYDYAFFNEVIFKLFMCIQCGAPQL